MVVQSVRHISISGDLGSGKSAVAERVSQMVGYEVVSTGALQRQMAREMRMSTLEANRLAETDESIDARVDGLTSGLGRSSERPIVFDSRMAWKMVPQSFKVRLIVDPEEAADRVLMRDAESESYETVAEAHSAIRERFLSEVRRFKVRYDVDVTALKNYDLVIDTSDATIDEVARLVVRRYWTGSPGLFIAPSRAVLLAGELNAFGSEEVSVIYVRPDIAVVSGVARVNEALSSGDHLLEAVCLAEDDDALPNGMTARALLGTRKRTM